MSVHVLQQAGSWVWDVVGEGGLVPKVHHTSVLYTRSNRVDMNVQICLPTVLIDMGALEEGTRGTPYTGEIL